MSAYDPERILAHVLAASAAGRLAPAKGMGAKTDWLMVSLQKLAQPKNQ